MILFGNRTGDVWHIWVEGIQTGQLYSYRVDGSYQPQEGYRFNFNKLLLDPFATAITHRPHWDFHQAVGYDLSDENLPSKVDDSRGNAQNVFLLLVTLIGQDDQPLKHPRSKLVIYETHVRGLTDSSSSAA